jgi:hypothetical protein
MEHEDSLPRSQELTTGPYSEQLNPVYILYFSNIYFNTILYCTVLYCYATLFYSILSYFILCYAMLQYAALHNTTPYRTIPFHTTPHFTIHLGLLIKLLYFTVPKMLAAMCIPPISLNVISKTIQLNYSENSLS